MKCRCGQAQASQQLQQRWQRKECIHEIGLMISLWILVLVGLAASILPIWI